MNQYEKLRAFGQEVADRKGRELRILDVGAGDGAQEYSPFFKSLAECYVGVDPDHDIEDNAWVDEKFQMSAEQFAAQYLQRVESGEAELFDLAISIYVWEHLEDPVSVLRAVHEVLAPGATCICVTPNGLHPFGLASKVLAKFALTDKVLRKLRPEDIDHYHFPVVAKQNTVWGVRSVAEEAGFSHVNIELHDEPGVFVHYLPEKLRQLPYAYSKVIDAINLDVASGTLIIRLTK